jgi:hypothetical protein
MALQQLGHTGRMGVLGKDHRQFGEFLHLGQQIHAVPTGQRARGLAPHQVRPFVQ